MRPRVWLAAILVCLLQTGAISAMIANRAIRLAYGHEIVLHVVPIDPRDYFRGDYVRLSYEISSVPIAQPERLVTGMPIFVTLQRKGQPEEGKWVAVAASPVRPALPETDNTIVLQGVARWGRVEEVDLTYGIETYFVPEGMGHDLERMTRAGSVKAVVSVDLDGNAAIKALIADGTRYDEPLF
ncbi:MAG: GDYXXLXY domain-containing protein [Rhodomicrobium sp.]